MVGRAERAQGRLYYGWVLVGVLALTVMMGYGILTYAFPVFLAPMGKELGWSTSVETGAFSLALLMAGLAAPAIGRWVDRRGARGPMTAGSVLATALLFAWSRVHGIAAYYAVWLGLGLAMSAVLYEPAFAVVANWFVRRRARALTVLTFVAGLASVVFVPVATLLVGAWGWRRALTALACVFGAVTIPLHALLLRRRPEDLGLLPDGAAATPAATATDEGRARVHPGNRHVAGATGVAARLAVRSGSFRWLALAFGLASLVGTAVMVHLIPLLLGRGYSAAFAGTALGALGLMALPGRLVFTPLGDRWPRTAVTASIFALQALGIAVLLVSAATAGVWIFVALYGAGFGAITPARAALLADHYGAVEFGRINGVLALVIAVARAVAPVGASLAYAATGGYAMVLLVLLALSAVAGLGVLQAGRSVQGPGAVAPGSASRR
jgi:MFS family permease